VPGHGWGIHKGSFDPIALRTPYLATSPTAFTANGDSFGPFARPNVGTWGDLGRDSLWGPSLFNVDSTLSKNFTLHDRLQMQLIVQAYNVFNHVNYGEPASCVDCLGNSGYIQGTVSEQDGTSLRRLQFAGRFQF